MSRGYRPSTFHIVFSLVGVYLFSMVVSCSSSGQDKNAFVVGKGMDCGWLIQFHEKPTGLPQSLDNTYIIVNNNSEYHLTDVEVFVEVRSLLPTDNALACTALGPAYTQVFVENMEY